MNTKQERKEEAVKAYKAITGLVWEAYEAKCKEIDAEEEEPIILAEAEKLLGRKIVTT